ncbi:autotransporter domain-containing protein [Sphingomonas sp. SM33]|uniref:Autotransporter domain-containing protein n=1 Tax=Sphingomonas telluris TaxID=2907998 RepID=A0ABS9VR89_9SPHN|nr:autotransporter domain-containing protein [Sphingomonas telluris]MCH8617049.1 autotransporter domain-containing protein [Sphingomonas telluris]
MRFLLATTGLGAIAAAIAAVPANAETVISTAVTTNQSTSASGDIRISNTGSVKPTSGVAVTVNTNNYAKNEGTIAIQGSNNSAGIVANAGLTGDISNSGTITIDENYTATDTDSDGDIDGAFAQGSGRFGIHVLGALAGNIANSGTITVEGNNSGGIVLDGPLTGNITNSGSISLLGNDTVGIKAGDVSGNVTLSKGTIQVQGANGVGVSLTGDIGGALVIQNTVQTTGYRYTTPPADTSKLDADDLLQGGSAVVVSGNVAGGILFDARPKDNSTTDTDEDDDGVPDADESTATITTLGAAPAVVIGSTTEDTTIGAVAGSGGKGIVIKGAILGSGVYSGVAGNGMVVGGMGHAVSVAGGMSVSGTVAAVSNGGNATGLRIGAGATVPTITVSGAITAQGGSTATSTSQALVIDAGANVSTIKNTGTIAATLSGADGVGSAIVDKSGTVTLIENSGTIGVASAASLGTKAIAFDLTANTTGATIRQLAVTSGSAPQIAGQILFGSGNDVLDVADGTVTGAAKFGGGDNRLSLSGDAIMNGAVTFEGGADTLTLGGTSSLAGDVDFGGGADVLTLTGTSALNGKLSNSAGLAVNVGAGSTLNATNLGAVNLSSLTTGSGAKLGVTVDSTAGTNTLYNVTGAAAFGTGTIVDVHLTSLGGAEGTYKIVQAGTLTGGTNLTSTVESLPFLFESDLVTTTPNEISLVIRQKSNEELGVNLAEGSILDAVIEAADADAPVASVFLGAQDSATLRDALQQMLPENAGGTFETATKGSRLVNKLLIDPKPPAIKRGQLGIWLEQVAWGGSKSIGDTSSYDLNGWGMAAGVETSVGPIGNVGATLSYLSGKDGRKSSDNEIRTDEYEAGLYWRTTHGPFSAFARGTIATINFDGSRFFTATVDGAPISREADGEWKGHIYSATAGVSYDARFGNLSLRPTAVIEHYSLKEKGYSESGGGDAFNLTVDSRKSDETAVTGTLALGYQLVGGGKTDDGGWMRLELEGGRRQILSGKLGTTTARFGDDGTPFTVAAEERTSGFVGAFRAIGGSDGLSITGELNAEEQQDKLSIGGRLGLQFAF